MIKYVSLFSGIGGFELGIQEASERTGIKTECVMASEIDKSACTIYENRFGSDYLHGDITEINAADVPEHDLIVFGFPCQNVSIAGKREGLCGERSGLFFEAMRIIREKQPRCILIENVKGLLSSNGGWDFARVLIELEDAGYIVEWEVRNTKTYLPQNRERVYIIGHLAASGGNRQEIFPIREDDYQVNDVQEQYTNTITTRYEGAQAVGSYIIESELNAQRRIRHLTPIEIERLQGFPDNFTAGVVDTNRYRCLGNSVTVPVVADIVEKILKTL